MESVKYCAYNITRASYLNLRLTVIDALSEPISGHIRGLGGDPQGGLWLTPCREIPQADRTFALDLVYLDEGSRVVQVVELSPGAACDLPMATAASALVLPSHAISASQTRCGDELMIWASYGVEKESGGRHKPTKAYRAQPQEEPPVTKVAGFPGGFSLLRAGEESGTPQAATERFGHEERAACEHEEKRSFTERLKAWTSDRLSHQNSDIPISIINAAYAPAVESAESLPATESPVRHTAAPSGAYEVPSAPRAAMRRLDEEGKAGSAPEEESLLKARLRSWTSEMSAHQEFDRPIPVVSAPVPRVPVVESTRSFLAKETAHEHRAVAPPADMVRTRPQAAEAHPEKKRKSQSRSEDKLSLTTRFLRWVHGKPAERHRLPGLVAYFWTGGIPEAHPVSNISTSGLYLLTQERWVSETVLLINLQRAATERNDSPESISVLSKVVRLGADGVGLKFVTPDSVEAQSFQGLPPIHTDKATLERFLQRFERSLQLGIGA